MGEGRPDPDELLSRLRDEDARAARGRLRIFFGASAGVGKTTAMLASAHQLARSGRDVVIGIVETHGRKDTEVLTAGLEALPLRRVAHRDREISEFDIDAALARRPSVILVDELAHSNVAGSRHPKRWQDIEELLSAGIDVFTTVNVQHLETLRDIVGGITGIRVFETVPDRVFDAADEVVLVDLPPDELLQRLKEGKVYLPEQARRAVQNFFRKGNLIALRELALRRTADRVDSEMIRYRRDRSVDPVWQTRESLLACVGPGEAGERVVRSAARLAARLNVPWHAVYVETPELARLVEREREAILRCLRQAQDAGAQTVTLSAVSAAEAIVSYAREHNLARLVVGRGRARSLRPWSASFAARIGRDAPDLDVIEIARSGREESAPRRELVPVGALLAPWQSFAMAALLCALATGISMPLASVFDLANIAMVFLLAVVVAAVRYGLGPAVAAAFLNVASFDFFFVPPRYSFAVSDVQYLLTFAVMLIVGLVTAKMTADLKRQARVAGLRERRVRGLYEMARDLSGALLSDQIAEICERFARSVFGARAAIVLADNAGRLQPAGPGSPGSGLAVDAGICQWTFDHGVEAGAGTDTLPGSPVLYLPLKAPMRVRGVLAIEPESEASIQGPEQRRLLETFARLVAIAVERLHYVDVAQDATVQIESERLRNSLLSAISHDLRTPLSALVGLADTLFLTKPAPTPSQAEIATAIREEVLRMSAQVNNLLDMARLQAGAVRLDRQWQPLEEVVGSAIQSMRSALAAHHVAVQLPEDLPLLEFDAVLIERVLANLLDNAAKYTPAGSHIVIGAGEGAPGMIEVWVEDDGPGLPAGREEAIFQKFERGQKESATAGVGLGLTISRAIVDAHHGTIRALQRPGGPGARFVFTLPRGEPPQVPEHEEEAGDPPDGA